MRIDLPGSTERNTHLFKHCAKCVTDKPPEGGIQMNPAKWYCAACWINKNMKNKRKP